VSGSEQVSQANGRTSADPEMVKSGERQEGIARGGANLYQCRIYASVEHIPVWNIYQWGTYTSGEHIPVWNVYQWGMYASVGCMPVWLEQGESRS
jgi:hypothetical protein